MKDRCEQRFRYPPLANAGTQQIQEEVERTYDLDERLIEFASLSIDLTEKLPSTKAGNHIAGQLVRSGTSPAPNYGEAMACESRKDFVHKMGICLKELRESFTWLRIINKKEMIASAHLAPALKECEELIRIFKSSITTARNKQR